MSTKKIIIAIELVFVVLAVIYILSISPKQISPLDGMVITETDFDFEFENADTLIISRDENFSKAMIFNERFSVRLPPGTYYWKVKNRFRESEIRNFTIQGNVALNLEKRNAEDDEENEIIYRVENVGNVDVNLTKKSGSMVGYAILGIGEELEISENKTENMSFEGRQR